MQLAELFVEEPAGELGEPEIHSGVRRKNDGAEQYVVDVCDDEVGVRHLEVRGGEARMMPVNPPKRT